MGVGTLSLQAALHVFHCLDVYTPGREEERGPVKQGNVFEMQLPTPPCSEDSTRYEYVSPFYSSTLLSRNCLIKISQRRQFCLPLVGAVYAQSPSQMHSDKPGNPVRPLFAKRKPRLSILHKIYTKSPEALHEYEVPESPLFMLGVSSL